MSRTLKDVLEDFRKSSYVIRRGGDHVVDVVLDWDELESAINYYIQTERDRQVRLDEARWWYNPRTEPERLRKERDERIAALENEGVKA